MEKLKVNRYKSFLDNAINCEININGERCRKVFEFDKYFISATGRIYKTVPTNKTEKLLSKQDSNILYFAESNYKNSNLKHLRVKLIDNDDKYKYRLPVFLVALSFGFIPKNYLKNLHEPYYLDKNNKNLDKNNISFKEVENTNIKLDLVKVKKIKRLIELDIPLKSIAEVYGVTSTTIFKIKIGVYWSNEKSTYKPPKCAIKVKDRIIRRLLATFNAYRLSDQNLRKAFTLKINKEDKNYLVIGFTSGFKFKKYYKSISNARYIVYRLNRYFFDESITAKINDKLNQFGYKSIENMYKNLKYEKNRS